MKKNDKKSPGWGSIVTAAVFILLVGGLFVANLIYTAPQVSASERRPLAQRPPLTVADSAGAKSFNWDFMGDFETYALDSFAGRDGFRRLKAQVLLGVFRQSDNNDIYIVDGSAVKLDTLDEAQAVLTAGKILKLQEALLADMNTYYAVVPDKGYYLSGGRYPTVDYKDLAAVLADALPGLTAIDLLPALGADSYYATDLHWRQEQLGPVLEALGRAMGFEAGLADCQATVLSPFYGAYYGQAALPMAGESLSYLTAPWMEAVTVRYLDEKTLELTEGPMYWPEGFEGIDPYDVYLKGAQPLITLENPDAATDKTLYLFRDSFGSSLAPLLSAAYSRVVLIDLRYLASLVLPQLVTFEPGADVLFLYSTQVLGDSSLLLVS